MITQENLHDITLDWYNRSSDKLQDLNEQNLQLLEAILLERKLPLQFITQFVGNLREAPEPQEQQSPTATSKKEEPDNDSLAKKAGDGDVASQLKVASLKANADLSKSEIKTIQTDSLEHLRKLVTDGFGQADSPPGTPSSMWNEVVSQLAVYDVIVSNAPAQELQLMHHIAKTYGNTALGDEISNLAPSSAVRVADMDGVSKQHRPLYSRSLLAAKNALRKVSRIREMLEKLDWENVVVLPFIGDKAGLVYQRSVITASKKIVTVNKQDKIVDLPSEIVFEFIANAGGDDNPTDTSVFLYNKDTGQCAPQFYSDKDSPSATVANATVVGDLIGDHVRSLLESLVNDPVAFTEEDLELVWAIRSEHAQQVREIENKLLTTTTQPAKGIMSVLQDDYMLDRVVEFMKNLSNGSDPEKYWKREVVARFQTPLRSPRKGDGNLTASAERALKYLPDVRVESYDERSPSDREAALAFFLCTTKEPPSKTSQKVLMAVQQEFVVMDTVALADEIEAIRLETLDAEHHCVTALDQKKMLLVDGVEIGLGTYVEAQTAWKRGHFDMMEGSGIFEHPYLFEINMSGTYMNGDVLRQALKIASKNEFLVRFRLGKETDQIGNIGDVSGRVTGRTKIVYAVMSDGEEIPIMTKCIRSKHGMLGNLEIMYKWTRNMRKLFEKYGSA